ncbi:hypothetical protein D3C74_186320 [compost metagenome]
MSEAFVSKKKKSFIVSIVALVIVLFIFISVLSFDVDFRTFFASLNNRNGHVLLVLISVLSMCLFGFWIDLIDLLDARKENKQFDSV